MNGIGDEHTLLLGLDWFGDVARTIGRWRADEVAGFDKEWRRGVFACWGKRRGDRRGKE